jgi:hypothetical protein
MREETVRDLIREFKLPKEALAFLITQSEKTRAEIVRIIAQEVRSYLENTNMHEVISSYLDGITLEIKTEIKFTPREDRLDPEVENSMEVKKTKKLVKKGK